MTVIPMKVEEIELRIVPMTLVTPFRASSHAAHELHHILVRIRAGGLSGWGEVSAPDDPYYLGETVEGAWHMLKDFLVPKVVGKSFADVESFRDAYANVKGNTFAKAGLECAAWDWFGKATERSIAQMLGGTQTEVTSGVALGMEEEARLLDQIHKHVDAGYRRVKLKIAPGHDHSVIHAVRARFPTLPIMADANSAYSLKDVPKLRALDAFDLMMIEQPLAFDDFIEHAQLQSEVRTPICLDESVRSLNDARTAIALKSANIINIKVARVGGLLEAKRIHDACAAAGIPVWCGGMHDYGVGRAANLAISSLPNFTLPGDISGFDKYFLEDLVEPPIVAHKGAIPVPTAPGLGFAVNEKFVLSKTVRLETVR